MRRTLLTIAVAAAAASIPAQARAAIITYEFTLRATLPNPDIPGTHQPFGITTATPATPFQARLSYEVTGGSASLVDFEATVGTRSWTGSSAQIFNATLAPDDTLQSLFFRADSDGNGQQPWEDIIGIFINFGGSTFWRAFEGNCQSTQQNVFGACLEGREGSNGISYRITRSDPVPEPATLLLVGAAVSGALARRRRH